MEPHEDTLMMDMQLRAVATASLMEMKPASQAPSVSWGTVSSTPTCIYMMPGARRQSPPHGAV